MGDKKSKKSYLAEVGSDYAIPSQLSQQDESSGEERPRKRVSMTVKQIMAEAASESSRTYIPPATQTSPPGGRRSTDRPQPVDEKVKQMASHCFLLQWVTLICRRADPRKPPVVEQIENVNCTHGSRVRKRLCLA
jgi:hypothetical protein